MCGNYQQTPRVGFCSSPAAVRKHTPGSALDWFLLGALEMIRT
jgi:hypothetical protein